MKGLARWGIRTATGFTAEAPLSGQRAVRGDLLRSLAPFASRFGVETAMTIDARRRGASVIELPVDMDHRHTGRQLAGIAHRARQGVDVLRALWPRVLSSAQRGAVVVGLGVIAALTLALLGSTSVPASGTAIGPAESVVIVAVPDLRWADLEQTPTLRELAGSRGAAANANVGTPGDEPRASATWATAGAGDRMAGFDLGDIPQAPADEPLRVMAMEPALAAQRGRHPSSSPGALGDALAKAGVPTGLVALPSSSVGLVVADRNGRTTFAATGAPASQALSMLRRGARVVAVDAAPLTPSELDAELSSLVRSAGERTLVMVVAGSSPQDGFELEPIIATGPGATSGTLTSPTTRRPALVSLVDIAPTVLEVLGLPRPDPMVGRPLHRTAATPDLEALSRVRRDSDTRTRSFLALSVGLGIAAGLVLLASFVPALRRLRPLRYASLAWASWPVSCLLVDAVPTMSALGPFLVGAITIVLGWAIAAAVGRGRLTMSALGWIGGVTAFVYAADLATGARLQFNSMVGVSAATTSRFTGLPNTGFAAFAPAVVLAVAALRRDTAISRTTMAVLFALAGFVVAWPTLGGDAGGLITLAPVSFVLWIKLAGRVPWRSVVAAAFFGIALVGLIGIADLARPEDSRTHVGRFLAGDTDIGSTVARRIDGNLASYTLFPVILVGLTILLGAVLLAGRWTNVFPRGSVERAAAGAIIAIALIGNAVNDSGAINTAVSVLFLVPLIYLAGRADDRRCRVRPRRCCFRGRARCPSGSVVAFQVCPGEPSRSRGPDRRRPGDRRTRSPCRDGRDTARLPRGSGCRGGIRRPRTPG